MWRAYVSCAVSRGDDARARQTQVGDDRNLRPFRDSLDLARLPFFIKVLNKKPGDSAAAAFSNESAANYTLGRAETRVDKGALVAGHALPRRRPRWRAPPGRGGRTRTDGGESSADGRTDGRRGGHADNIMELGNVATKWLQLWRFDGRRPRRGGGGGVASRQTGHIIM